MDEIQKVLVKAGRKDLAQKYYKKVAEEDKKAKAKKALDALDKAGQIVTDYKLWILLKDVGMEDNDGPEQMLDAWEHIVKVLRDIIRKG